MTVNHISRPGAKSPENEEARWPSPPDPGDLSKRVAQWRAEQSRQRTKERRPDLL